MPTSSRYYNVTYTYTYDANGNITSVSDGTYTTTYTYDSQNQLIREDNQQAEKTWTWTYDDAGNILSKKRYAYTTGDLGAVLGTVTYGYDSEWGDLLVSFGGKKIDRDQIGNIIAYGNEEDANRSTYTWEHGRELVMLEAASGTDWTYTYDANGMRTSRSNGTKTYSYVYNGSKLTQMTVGTYTLNFTYDASGVPMTMSFNGTVYYYATNLQGDVVSILNAAGEELVHYTYDAWGNPLSKTGSKAGTLGWYNPLRYRGYVFDEETDLYYLQSRYYNPQMGRFINTDAVMGVNADMATYNLFAYCGNNPVIRYDTGGMCWEELVRTVLHKGNEFAIWIGIDTAAVGAFLLMMEADENGVYHAKFHCWQQIFGYNDLYDVAFDIGTSMVSKKFPFTCNGLGYTIWAWKGDYINLGAGAELGIYRGSVALRSVDTSLAMWMGMVVIYNDETIIQHFPSEDQWWITSFNPDYQRVNADDLFVTIGVGFNNLDMYRAFKSRWGSDSQWVFSDYLQLAVLRF